MAKIIEKYFIFLSNKFKKNEKVCMPNNRTGKRRLLPSICMHMCVWEEPMYLHMDTGKRDVKSRHSYIP